MLSALTLGACANIPIIGPDTSLESFQPITTSCRDTPETRKQIIQHNSAYDTLKTGKQVVYADICPKAKTQQVPTS